MHKLGSRRCGINVRTFFRLKSSLSPPQLSMHAPPLICEPILSNISGEWVLPTLKNGKQRRDLIFKHLLLTNPPQALATQQKRISLLVGTRPVCPQVYCDNWCISRAQLDRYSKLIKEGCRDLDSRRTQASGDRCGREARKKDFVVTWFVQYAAEVTEKLPDCDKLLLPRMLWRDLHKQFCEDMLAAGYGEADVCVLDYFRQVFNTAEELLHMEMTTYKRNFCKCDLCVSLTAAVNTSLKGHDAEAVEKAKAARLEHYLLARSDKLHYWQQRWQVRGRCSFPPSIPPQCVSPFCCSLHVSSWAHVHTGPLPFSVEDHSHSRQNGLSKKSHTLVL